MAQKDRVKAICKEKGISIHKLETDLGFGNGYISQLKKGFPADRLVKIADYLDVKIDYLIEGDIYIEKIKTTPDDEMVKRLYAYYSMLTDDQKNSALDYVKYLADTSQEDK